MAVTLIASWGGTQDNCYITVDEADDYIGNSVSPGHKVDPSAWENANEVQRASAILAATRDIDGHVFAGQRQFHDQTLEFPRLPSGEDYWPWVNRSLTEANTFNIYLTEQKRRVKAACAEQAFTYIREGERNEHLERQIAGIRSFSETVGPISESYSYGGTSLSLTPEAMRLLMPYRTSGMPLYRA